MYNHSNQSLIHHLQEYEVIWLLGTLKWQQYVQKLPNVSDFSIVFFIAMPFTGPLVVIWFHVLVEEVLSFDFSDVISKSIRN